jgi:hypothetical protein
MVLRCFTKRMWAGEFEIGVFLGFWAGDHVGVGGGGAIVCNLGNVGGGFVGSTGS